MATASQGVFSDAHMARVARLAQERASVKTIVTLFIDQSINTNPANALTRLHAEAPSWLPESVEYAFNLLFRCINVNDWPRTGDAISFLATRVSGRRSMIHFMRLVALRWVRDGLSRTHPGLWFTQWMERYLQLPSTSIADLQLDALVCGAYETNQDGVIEMSLFYEWRRDTLMHTLGDVSYETIYQFVQEWMKPTLVDSTTRDSDLYRFHWQREVLTPLEEYCSSAVRPIVIYPPTIFRDSDFHHMERWHMERVSAYDTLDLIKAMNGSESDDLVLSVLDAEVTSWLPETLEYVLYSAIWRSGWNTRKRALSRLTDCITGRAGLMHAIRLVVSSWFTKAVGVQITIPSENAWLNSLIARYFSTDDASLSDLYLEAVTGGMIDEEVTSNPYKSSCLTPLYDQRIFGRIRSRLKRYVQVWSQGSPAPGADTFTRNADMLRREWLSGVALPIWRNVVSFLHKSLTTDAMSSDPAHMVMGYLYDDDERKEARPDSPPYDWRADQAAVAAAAAEEEVASQIVPLDEEPMDVVDRRFGRMSIPLPRKQELTRYVPVSQPAGDVTTYRRETDSERLARQLAYLHREGRDVSNRFVDHQRDTMTHVLAANRVMQEQHQQVMAEAAQEQLQQQHQQQVEQDQAAAEQMQMEDDD